MSAPYRTASLTRNGLTFSVDWRVDDLAEFPSNGFDLAGELRTVHSHYGQPDKRPGDLVIYHERGEWHLYAYDHAVANLRRSGLSGADAAKAARVEYEWLRRFYTGDAWYAYITVTLSGTAEYETLSGVADSYCSDSEALSNVADYLADFVEELTARAAELVQQAHASGRFPAYV